MPQTALLCVPAHLPSAARRGLCVLSQLQTRQRLKGHQNTSRNFVRASFGHKSLVVSGSEVRAAPEMVVAAACTQ